MSITLYRKRHPPVGSAPGTLMLPVGGAPVHVHYICYSPESIVEKDVSRPDELPDPADGERILWVDVQGLGDEAFMRDLASRFDIHPLAVEDVVNAPQRPKSEAYDAHLLLISRMIRFLDEGLDVEQVAIFVGKNYVLSFQERSGDGDVLDPVRRRLREGKGLIRSAGAGYLGYAILDTIIDAYYPLLENVSERLTRLEERVLSHPTQKTLERLNQIKIDLVLLRRAMWPQLESTSKLVRDESPFLSSQVRVYLRDTADHCAQIVDVIDSHRELVSGLLNTYISIVSNKTNEVMKVLTMMASIFIPLTFVVGVYGMNLKYMPEISSPWAYPVVLAVMAAIAVGMVFYFRRRGWIGGGDDDPDDD